MSRHSDSKFGDSLSLLFVPLFLLLANHGVVDAQDAEPAIDSGDTAWISPGEHLAFFVAPLFHTQDFRDSRTHGFWFNVFTSPVLDADYTLIHEHTQAVDDGASFRLGRFD